MERLSNVRHAIFICVVFFEVFFHPASLIASETEVCRTTGQFKSLPIGCQVGWQIWSAPQNLNVQFTDAQNFCQSLPQLSSDFKPWRLPVVHELEVLAALQPDDAFYKSLDNFFWSSTFTAESEFPQIYYPMLKTAQPASKGLETDTICVSDLVVSADSRILAAANYSSCAIKDDRLICWGSHTSEGSPAPILSHPRQVSLGSGFGCAIDDSGVKCWGVRNPVKPKDLEALQNPRQIAAGRKHLCALDDSGVRCWGDGMSLFHGEPLGVLQFSNPKQVSSGDRHACVLDDAGVQCWGKNSNGELTLPTLVYPKQIASGPFGNCAIDRDGVKCWGWDNLRAMITVPPMQNPTQISVGPFYACAIDSGELKCWGKDGGAMDSEHVWNSKYANGGHTEVPSLHNVQQVAVGENHTCALGDGGITCWGTPMPAVLNPPN
ncbi:MAG: RCC1 domain-containing protein [Proteobacteria bacterium]|nr:RCC1 domain-containing protein [Pseudomonadota bacterium]